MITLKNFIRGELTEPVSGQYLSGQNPATGETFLKVPDSDHRDVELAVKAASEAFSIWSKKSISSRSKILHRLADLIERDAESFARCETQDSGKPIGRSRDIEIPRAVANLRFFASAIVNHASQAHVMEDMAVNYTRRPPLGIVGCISPWNLPLYLFTWKIAPALAMGNCVIAKPSELTPYTAFKFSELANEAGLPPGVLNVLHGLGPKVGQAMVDHQQVKAISFTGGTSTGRIISESCARSFKKVSLELGGKNPNIIFADCDFEEAISTTVKSSFSNQGEICLCGSRILVEKSIYDRFKDELVFRTKKLIVGDPMSEVDLGALISKDHLSKVLGFVRQAGEEGGTILTGGNQIEGPGYFMEPTIIEGLDASCTINQKEVFGPVVTLTPFETEEEALEIANNTEYGLSATIWTSNLKRAHWIAHQLQSGIVWVNCWLLRDLRTPFGGMKNSGVGREGGDEALRFFSEAQNICIKM